MDSNKRKSERFDALNLISFVVMEKNQAIMQGMGRTLNVSETGLLMEVSSPVSPRQILSIRLGLEEDVVEFFADIVRCSEEGKGKFQLGCQFHTMDEASRRVLSHYIEQFQASKA